MADGCEYEQQRMTPVGPVFRTGRTTARLHSTETGETFNLDTTALTEWGLSGQDAEAILDDFFNRPDEEA